MLEVVTGSRLHFGLLELAAGQPLRFGGLGLMLDEPGWVLQFRNTATLSGPPSGTAQAISSDIADRIQKVCANLKQQLGSDFNFQIDVLRTLPMHSGLGAGTQLATAVAFGLALLARRTQPSTEELVQLSGRGKRSGIGLYGFVHGGLILDEGHSQEAERIVRARSVNLNPDWRIVLITPDQAGAVTGGYEASLLERLGQTPNSDRARMHELAKHALELAVLTDGFVKFTSVLQEYVDAAGRLFAAGQGGMYNGQAVSRAVELAKENGLRAVGQSSWGPTVFGFAERQVDAEQIAAKLTELRPDERWQIRICTPASHRASWRWLEE